MLLRLIYIFFCGLRISLDLLRRDSCENLRYLYIEKIWLYKVFINEQFHVDNAHNFVYENFITYLERSNLILIDVEPCKFSVLQSIYVEQRSDTLECVINRFFHVLINWNILYWCQKLMLNRQIL